MQAQEILSQIAGLKILKGNLKVVLAQIMAVSVEEAAPSGNYEDQLTTSIYLKDLRSSYLKAFIEITNSIEKLEIQAKLKPLLNCRVKEGDTLEHLALKYYGNPHEWPKIMEKNYLKSTDLTPGDLLIIPQ